MHAKKSHASLCTRALYITYLMVTKAKQAFTPKMTHGVCTLGTKEYEDPTLGIWEFCLNQIPGCYTGGVSTFFPHLGEIAIKFLLRLFRRIIIFFTQAFQANQKIFAQAFQAKTKHFNKQFQAKNTIHTLSLVGKKLGCL